MGGRIRLPSSYKPGEAGVIIDFNEDGDDPRLIGIRLFTPMQIGNSILSLALILALLFLASVILPV